jgi:hypothetical protein
MEYYEYALVYVDDLLVLSHQPDKIMKALQDFYRLKDGFAKPDRYLGAENSSKTLWALSSYKWEPLGARWTSDQVLLTTL